MKIATIKGIVDGIALGTAQANLFSERVRNQIAAAAIGPSSAPHDPTAGDVGENVFADKEFIG